MRIVNVDLSQEFFCSRKMFGGNAGEHNETKLVVKLPKRMLQDDISYYYFEFQTILGEHIVSPNIYKSELLDGDKISVILWEQLLLFAGNLNFCVSAVSLAEDNTIAIKGKTPAFTLQIFESPTGKDTLIDVSSTKEDLQKAIDEAIKNVDLSGYATAEALTNGLAGKQDKFASVNVDIIQAITTLTLDGITTNIKNKQGQGILINPINVELFSFNEENATNNSIVPKSYIDTKITQANILNKDNEFTGVNTFKKQFAIQNTVGYFLQYDGTDILIANVISAGKANRLTMTSTGAQFSYFEFGEKSPLKVTGILTPTEDNDAVNKKYVDDLVGDINTILATMFNDVSTQSDEEPTDVEVTA